MKPYYEHAGIVIYHGDCREILPQLEPADLVLADPPYNCGKDYGTWDDSLPQIQYEDIMREIVNKALALAPNQAWVAPRYQLDFWLSLLPSAHLVVIRRGAHGPSRAGWSDQFEIALALGRPSVEIPDMWNDIRLKGEGWFFQEECYAHPGYTPAPIMRRFAKVLSSDSLIDPFCGTGTSLAVAKQLGRRAIGIEIEEKYCEIAAKRLSQEVLAFGETFDKHTDVGQSPVQATLNETET